MIGSGAFLLPSSLAPFGWNAIFAWLITIAGALALAVVYARLSHAFPHAGGPYAYTQEAFGPALGFAVAWSYWLSVIVGNAAIATGSVSYLSNLFPDIGRVHSIAAVLTLGIVWLLTFLNCLGVRQASGFQALTTVLKLLPLAGILIVAPLALLRGGTKLLLPYHPHAIHFSAISGAATLTLWAFLGLESATVPANKVKNAARTIPRATLAGTVFAGLIYLFVCSAVMLMLPANQLQNSPAPLSDFLDRFWGGHTGTVLAIFATISSMGCLIGWVLLQGEMACVMAARGVFPAWLAQTSANGTPVRAHMVSSAILTLLIATTFNRSMVDLFTFIVLLATTGCLFAYLFTGLAALTLQKRRQLKPSFTLVFCSLASAVYSAWAIWGAGREAAFWGLAAFLIAFPLYAVLLWWRRLTPASSSATQPSA